MVYAMVLGGLRRCEVLGLDLGHIQVPERSLFIAEGKGGHQHIVPISNTFLTAVGDYLRQERPKDLATDRVFVTLKGPNRGRPVTPDGVDKILQAARARAGLERATCHQLRHTCLTRLREAGMELEAVQAQAGHVSIESTRIYLHLSDGWLAGEYRRAVERIDADAAAECRRSADERRTRHHPGRRGVVSVERVEPRVGGPVGPSAAAHGDHAPLPAATHHLPRPALGRGRRHHAAPARPLAHHHNRRRCRWRDHQDPRRGLQGVARRATRPEGQVAG
ncbi:MAG: tyrosine-type recombinase/integrase [Acidimicrobiales bacterium]